MKNVPGLSREQLSYYVKAGYVKPKTMRRGKYDYNDYSENDLLVIQTAFHYISEFDTQPKAAFERARNKLKQPQLELK